MSTSINKHLSIDEKNKLVQFLLESSIDGKVAFGKKKQTSILFGVSRLTVGRLWKTAMKQMEEGGPISLKSGKLGVPILKRVQFDAEKMKQIDYQGRSTMRSLAKQMEVSKTTLCRWIKEGLIRPHTSAIKPLLSDSNKLPRLLYSLSQLHVDRLDHKIKFNDMRNVIHIDEKWFFITKASHRYYLLPNGEEPYRSCKSKKFITKVMFICAVGIPQYASDGTMLWDGKVGMFPFTHQVPAQRNNKNRLRGTMETKNVESITKQVIKDCIITQIIPALKSKWPTTASKDIFIQQDNVKPHICNQDPDFRSDASSDGFNIQLVCQPPNSPDTNINDLGWFRSIQSLQQTKKAKDVESLVQNVNLAFEELTPCTLNKIFLSLQGCCIEILKVKGQNNYKIPHMNKERHINEGTLPDILEVDDTLVKDCIEFLQVPGNQVDCSYDVLTLMSDLGY